MVALTSRPILTYIGTFGNNFKNYGTKIKTEFEKLPISSEPQNILETILKIQVENIETKLDKPKFFRF